MVEQFRRAGRETLRARALESAPVVVDLTDPDESSGWWFTSLEAGEREVRRRFGPEPWKPGDPLRLVVIQEG